MSDNITNSTQGTIATGHGETDLRGYVSGVDRTIGAVIVVKAEEITVWHSDVCGAAPLYVFDCDGDGVDAEIELTGDFSYGDSFYFVFKAGTDGARIKSTQANLHEAGSPTGVLSIDIPMHSQYSLSQMVYTPIGWVMFSF